MSYFTSEFNLSIESNQNVESKILQSRTVMMMIGASLTFRLRGDVYTNAPPPPRRGIKQGDWGQKSPSGSRSRALVRVWGRSPQKLRTYTLITIAIMC